MDIVLWQKLKQPKSDDTAAILIKRDLKEISQAMLIGME